MKMENQPTLVLKLSLEEMALRRIVANLWIALPINWSFEDEDMAGWLAFCEDLKRKSGKWQETIEKVKSEVSKLMLPESLKQRMMHIVKPIGSDILGWKKLHEKLLYDSGDDFDKRILKQLCWTSEGSVDYQKTAKRLVCLEMLSFVGRYKLACLYCLVDFIPVLWTELSEEHKRFFYDEAGVFCFEELPMEYYWPYILMGERLKLDERVGDWCFHNGKFSLLSFHQHAFEISACRGNKAATEYFFQKLTYEERDSHILRTVQAVSADRRREIYRWSSDFPIEKLSDVLCYLLSLMDPEEQLQVLKEHPCDILKCFLDWPRQDLSLDIADFIWTFLPESKYDYLLNNIIENIRNSGYYFPSLFQKFFLSSPDDFKKHFMDRECQFAFFFSEFFDAEDTETMKVVFRNIDAEDRVRFVSSDCFFEYFVFFTRKENWHLIELCLREATLSKEEIKGLKEAFMRFLPETDNIKIFERQFKWERLFNAVFDEANASEVETLAKVNEKSKIKGKEFFV